MTTARVLSLEQLEEIAGEECLAAMLSQFSCPLNKRVEEFIGTYTAALYLIAHLGKNFALDEARQISGSELLGLAFDVLRKARKLVGGKLVLIDRESDRPKLLDFYKANGFKSWNCRYSKKDAVEYDQMLCVLKDESPTGGPGS